MCTCNLKRNVPLNKSLTSHYCTFAANWSAFQLFITDHSSYSHRKVQGDKPSVKILVQPSDCFAHAWADGDGLSLSSKMLMGILPPGLWDRPASHGPCSRTEGIWGARSKSLKQIGPLNHRECPQNPQTHLSAHHPQIVSIVLISILETKLAATTNFILTTPSISEFCYHDWGSLSLLYGLLPLPLLQATGELWSMPRLRMHQWKLQ